MRMKNFCALPYVVLDLGELAADRLNELVHRISCVGRLCHDDASIVVAVVGGIVSYFENCPPHLKQ